LWTASGAGGVPVLAEVVGAAIDAVGGSFTMPYNTVAVSAELKPARAAKASLGSHGNPG